MRSVFLILSVGLFSCLPCFGQVESYIIDVSSSATNGAVSAALDVGDTVDVTLSLASRSQAGLFGLDVAFDVMGESMIIQDVTFSSAFPTVVERDPAEESDKRIRFARTQSAENLNASLAANGAAVPFATVTLEILNGSEFTDSLVIEAQGALVGELASQTVVEGLDGAADGPRGRARIEIRNTNPAEQPPTPTVGTNMNETTSQASLELYLPGSEVPASQLSANTTYELYCTAQSSGVCSFLLYGVGQSSGVATITASSATSGTWSSPLSLMSFSPAEVSGEAVPAYGYPQGYYRYTCVAGDIMPGSGTSSDGYLCNITTGSAGSLGLNLILFDVDLQAGVVTEMDTDETFIVAQ